MTETKRIWLSPPHMSGEEEQHIKDVFESNWIAPVGPHLTKFEAGLVNYTKANHAVALSCGTAALHLALLILGIEKDDEVLCPALTFAGSVYPIIYQNAKPIFVESELKSWNMSPEFLEKAIQDRIDRGKKPKAAIVVDLYGMPADYEQLLPICAKYDIAVIEDAAEALGGSYQGEKLGSFGDLAALSFNGNKIITTSGGGALLSQNKELIDKARFLSTQARDKAPHYEHSTIGYNYRMSNILASIGTAQLSVLDQRVERRRAIFRYYQKRLGALQGLSFLNEPEGYISNRWLTNVLIDSELGRVSPESLRLTLEKDDIEARPLWKPMQLQPVFNSYPFYGDGTSEKLFKNGLCLPSGSSLTDNDLDRICTIIERAVAT